LRFTCRPAGRRRREAVVAGLLALACGALVPLGTGCAEHYRKSADKEVYNIIAAKTEQVPGMPRTFRLGDRYNPLPVPPLVQDVRSGKAVAPLSLTNTLALAAANSRDFQDEREAVYLAALALTRARHDFQPIFAGVFDVRQEDARGVRSRRGSTAFSVTQALATGGELSLRLSSSFMRFLAGDPSETVDSLLEFSMRQPLWRGAGRRVAEENLTQAERDMLYQIREFTRFRRTFFVSIATDFYRVLQQEDVVTNEGANLRNLTLARERAQMLAQAGRQPEFQVDQAEQDELRAKDRYIRARQRSESLLDSFKIRLGLPTEAPIRLARAELDLLRREGLREVPGTREEAVRRALACRLDLANAADRVRDAERKVRVARDNLGPDVDLVLRSVSANQPPSEALKFQKKLTTRSVGVEVDLPLDRLEQRNDYREALIALDRSRRAHSLLRDQIVLQIHDAWRKLQEARESYRIQLRSVDLAQRRVESTTLLMEAGRANMRDVLEAQEALLEARNGLTRTLVDYRIATLQLWRDMGTLNYRNGRFVEESPDDTLAVRK